MLHVIELGKMQQLYVISVNSEGAYLADFLPVDSVREFDGMYSVFLPKDQYSATLTIGEPMNVFVYSDDNGQLTASATEPKLTLGKLSQLTVIDVTTFGAFLHWGLAKDLLLPVSKQVGKLKRGDTCLVGLFINQRNRLCATMRIYDLLETDAPYSQNEMIQGTVYSINPDLGAFVAVDNKYHGFIHRHELMAPLAVGDFIEARVRRMREDGKLELALRKEAYQEIDSDAEKILDSLDKNGGALPINDNSDPDQIKETLQMSKRAFKRAVGRLLKEGAVIVTEQGIKRSW